MFVYQNASSDICITFADNKPVESPEYVLKVNAATQQVFLNGLSIPVLKTTVLEQPLNVEIGGLKITTPTVFNLNNQSITAKGDTDGSGVFHVQAGGSLVLDGEGEVNGVGDNDYNMAIWADGGNVAINSGTYTNIGAKGNVDPEHFDLIYAKNGSIVEIKGGYFACETPKWTLNSSDSAPGTFIVTGGTFYKYNPAASETEPGGIVSFVPAGYDVVYDEFADTYTVIKA